MTRINKKATLKTSKRRRKESLCYMAYNLPAGTEVHAFLEEGEMVRVSEAPLGESISEDYFWVDKSRLEFQD